ncbi:hypothetical protein [Streptomyces flavofungini]|uniref:Uncharacterized protein n=1 Tax=Streptomyces flavofungini TaxID=68200 RepID=A0ABS0WXM2_9ACTN|nr:hypothetical protein [Streptomyces flavofungini]MBJ3805561.1 hypothetical protein [Streptomyces flavofungini]GHC73172.1 hypothetical protein GCM10010349_50680 [Streptomyces flavofungini]
METDHQQQHAEGAYVAHASTDIYGPGRVLSQDGEFRRVRFTHFVATIRVGDLRAATPVEESEMRTWWRRKTELYGNDW